MLWVMKWSCRFCGAFAVLHGHIRSFVNQSKAGTALWILSFIFVLYYLSSLYHCRRRVTLQFNYVTWARKINVMEWNQTLILNEQTNWVISDESAGVRITALSLPPREKPGLFLAKDLTSWFIRWGVIVLRLIISATATVGPMRHRCCIVSAAAACPLQCRSCFASTTTMGPVRHRSYTVFSTIVGPMRHRCRTISEVVVGRMRSWSSTVFATVVSPMRH